MTYKFHRQVFSRAHGQLLEGSGVNILRQIVRVLAALIMPNRFHSFTGVGWHVLPTAHQIAIAVVIIIGWIAVLKHHLPFHIFQPPVTRCLHCPLDEIFSTPKWDNVIDVFPSSCSRVDLGYRVKSRAMLWEHIQGLRHVFVEPFSALDSGDDWEPPGVVP